MNSNNNTLLSIEVSFFKISVLYLFLVQFNFLVIQAENVHLPIQTSKHISIFFILLPEVAQTVPALIPSCCF